MKASSTEILSHIPVSIIMPVYNQANFIRVAIQSLINQTHANWELIIINDGSTDELQETIADILVSDARVRLISNSENCGLGYSLNKGIDEACHDIIAYLPADDIIFPDHIESLLHSLYVNDADLSYSGLRYKKDDVSGEGIYTLVRDEVDDKWLQLVQVMHRKTEERWVERSELATDDLGRMFWDKFSENHSKISATGKITCEWVSHTYQRHRIMNDRGGGGLYMYRTHYNVKHPIRYKSASGNLVDEIVHYSSFRQPVPSDKRGLKIVVVGELSYNPERLHSLEKAGHELYGLWINNPYCWNPTGPLAFGNIEDIPFENWEERIKEIQPDIIYGMLNFKAVDLAYHVFKKCRDIPFVWHFKEGPFYCRNYGSWGKLMELINRSDGTIYINETAREWYHQFMPFPNPHELVMDGDLPPEEWFDGKQSKLLSETTGEFHTFVAGRLLGISAHDIEEMAKYHIHIHIYGDIFHNQSRSTIDEAIAVVPEYVHLHPTCPSENWIPEFSQYDAGWLHWHHSINEGRIEMAQWQDFNSPARMSTYAIAGVPMIM